MYTSHRNYFLKVLTGIFILILSAFQQLAGQASISSFSIFEDNGAKGILDAEGKEVLPANYLDLGWTQGLPEFHQSIIGYRESDKWGLVNSSNKVITPPKYSHLYPARNSNLIVAAIPGKFSGLHFFGLINNNGKVVIPFTYTGIEVFGDVVIITTTNANRVQYGIVNMNNQPLLPFQYDFITPINKSLLAVTKSNRKIVLMNSRGKETIRYELDSIGELEGQYYRIYDEGKVGLMDMNGNLLASPEFKKIEVEMEKSKVSFLRFNEWKILLNDGKEGPIILADKVTPLQKGLYKITLNNQSWITDNNFNILSVPFDKIIQLSESHFKTERHNRCGLLNSRGDEILPTIFDSLSVDGPHVYALRVKGTSAEWSLFDTLGIQKTLFEYQNMKPCSEGLIPVKRRNKWGFLSREGMEMIQCVYDSVSPFQNNKSIVNLHGEEGIINSENNWIVYPEFKTLYWVNDSLLLEKRMYKNQLVTIDNDLIYFTENELKFEGTYFSEMVDSLTTWQISLQGTIINKNARPGLGPISIFDSLSIIYQKDNAGVISASGREVVPYGEWEEIYPPSEDFLGIKADDFYGFIDIDNKLRIANRYEGIGPFKEGLAAVKVRGKWGFINQRETIVCQPLYDEVGEFSNKTCVVRSGDKWGLIGDDGQIIQDTDFDSIETLENGYMITSSDDSYGLLDETGKTILFPKYEWLKLLDNEMVLIKRKDHYGILDQNGVNVFPSVYYSLQYLPERDFYLSMSPGKWETISVLNK